MSNYALERQKRRLTILEGISQDLKFSEIAEKLGVNRWVIMNDIRFMQNGGDPDLKHALKVQDQIKEKKNALFLKEKKHAIHNKRFLNMTGMTLQEKTFRNMIDFYKPELKKILKSRDQNAAIMKLPKSIRRTLMNNGIITKGWHDHEVASQAIKYVTSA